MHEWNVVVTVYDGGYNQARRLLHRYGPVEKTEYFNILLMRITEPRILLNSLLDEAERDPKAVSSLARVMPIDRSFSFMSAPEFEAKARDAVAGWVDELAGKSFHLRMHRRGFKGRLSSLDEERFLDTYLLEAVEQKGAGARINFDDPDVIIALETMGPRGGVSLWTRDDLKRYPLLHLD